MRLDIRYGVDECEPGAHGPFGIILLRAWIAEIDERAITHASGDHALVANLDDLMDAVLIRVHHPQKVFRVQPRRKGSRADQVAKHYRQLASLGFVWPHWFGRCSGRLSELRDGAQHLAAMPYLFDAQVLEILLRQIEDHRQVNGILDET